MNPLLSDEHVLVLPDSHFREAGYFEGFQPFSMLYLQKLLNPSCFSYRPRSEVETDPSFKQLIPYVVFRCRGEIFHYKRGSKGTEQRLQSLRSIGLGGHICAEDAPESENPYRTGMLRELSEEVLIDTTYREQYLGFIYDPRLPVGTVHLGVVHLFDLQEPKVYAREEGISEAGFASLGRLLQDQEQFETWSQFVLEELLMTGETIPRI